MDRTRNYCTNCKHGEYDDRYPDTIPSIYKCHHEKSDTGVTSWCGTCDFFEPKINWYDKNIEEPVRDTVRILRNNGFNTECSCGHQMYIQCQYITDGTIQELDTLLFDIGHRDYDITVYVARRSGHLSTSIVIQLAMEEI